MNLDELYDTVNTDDVRLYDVIPDILAAFNITGEDVNYRTPAAKDAKGIASNVYYKFLATRYEGYTEAEIRDLLIAAYNWYTGPDSNVVPEKLRYLCDKMNNMHFFSMQLSFSLPKYSSQEREDIMFLSAIYAKAGINLMDRIGYRILGSRLYFLLLAASVYLNKPEELVRVVSEMALELDKQTEAEKSLEALSAKPWYKRLFGN